MPAHDARLREYLLSLLPTLSIFGLLGLLLFHGFTAIHADLGRHLRLGEIIWQTAQVPDTNPFSFTQPDFPFVNHHWLSEVLFFGVWSAAGLAGLLGLKIVLLLSAVGLSFLAIPRRGWPARIALLLAILVFIERTEVRPEALSFALLGLYLCVLYHARYAAPERVVPASLWLLPFAQLLWVNFHIYFFVGPFLFAVFALDRLLAGTTTGQRRRLIAVGVAIGIATLANPRGLWGALEPFTILGDYGYNVVENQPLLSLRGYIGSNLSITSFYASALLLVGTSVFSLAQPRRRLFELVSAAFFLYAGFRMLRNLPLYALGTLPILALQLEDLGAAVGARWRPGLARVAPAARALASIAVVGGAALVGMLLAQNRLYPALGSAKEFGLSVPNGGQLAVDFNEQHRIRGPMFNNYDIGGYLIWQLPEEPVFVDNRPEAYPTRFLQQVYRRVQTEPAAWKVLSARLGIEFVFFSHHDATPWGQAFLTAMGRDPEWPVVYVNDTVVVFLRRTERHRELIDALEIDAENAVERIEPEVQRASTDRLWSLARTQQLMARFGWQDAARHFGLGARSVKASGERFTRSRDGRPSPATPRRVRSGRLR